MKVYLDYNATTPIDSKVAEAMQPFLFDYFGNPSSTHWEGVKTKKAVELARKQIAGLINCQIDELVFTSGGTESNNYAIKGTAYALKHKGNHIITFQIEHPAVIEVCKYLEKNGFEVSYISVNNEGIIDLNKLQEAIKPETILISVMHANNETGVIQPIEEIGKLAKSKGIIFHCDAAQSLGKIEADIQKMNVDLLSIAGHKLYAPKGIGALYIKRGLQLEKLIHGADHERNLRAGTENILEIAGLGSACAIAGNELTQRANTMKDTRDYLQNGILSAFPNAKINGHQEKRLPNTLNISFPGIEANLILAELEANNIAASAGAACHSEEITVSQVLTAMNIPVETAMGTIRFSTGKSTTREEIDYVLKILTESLNKLSGNIEQETTITRDVKLTQYTQGLGCACKLRPQLLEEVLKQIPKYHDPNVLVGTETSDDAAVYKINEEQVIVQTVDFFTPVVDDPYEFGAIAAANSISDIYAMGAKPLFALNVVGFPSNRLPQTVLQQILKGASDKAQEAGISILGGHTVDDLEPKFGMTVTGIAGTNQVLTNNKAKSGDLIILTKPIGTGIAATAIKRKLAEENTKKEAIKCMSTLNKYAAEIMVKYPVSACTDVTGFGLLGHLAEITQSSGVNAEINHKEVNLIDGVWELAVNQNVIPGGTKQNLSYIRDKVKWADYLSEIEKIILADAQTSGGLLICCKKEHANELLNELIVSGIKEATIIGKMTTTGMGTIKVI